MSSSTRTALITGAGQNIGRAIALALAADGFNIVINGLSNRAACEETSALLDEHGASSIIAMGDTGSRDDCYAMARPMFCPAPVIRAVRVLLLIP
ncbi:MAG: SDR family NAD(P)-dependent oxidoreductase, partial [Pseudomonadota bacterium]